MNDDDDETIQHRIGPDLETYSFLTKLQIRKLPEILSQVMGTGLHIRVSGECGCIAVYHPLFKDQIPIILNRNGEIQSWR